MIQSRTKLIASFVLVGCLAAPLKADTLGDAASALRAAQYDRAKSLVVAYYANGGPRRYRADFIRAVSDCRISKGQTWAQNRLKALKIDYVLTPAAASEVNRWISSCKPPPPPEPPEQAEAGNHETSFASGLTVPPSVETALTGGEPRALPRMSPLINGTAFRGDDYASPVLPSVASCQRRCQMEASCKSITYDLSAKICWMKRSVPSSGHSDNYVSSIKLNN